MKKRKNEKIKTALITGGGRGIGRQIAVGLSEKGYVVTIASRTLHELEETQGLIQKKGGHAIIKTVDIQNATDVDSLFRFHLETFGCPPQLAVNTAAIQGPIGYSWELDEKLWKETIDINLTGACYFACSAIRYMITRKEGSIILFSGGGAAYARLMCSSYGTAKTGILRLVENLSLELKDFGSPNIIVNAVAPGAVKTRMTEEILHAGKAAGEKALKEAQQTFQDGGTPTETVLKLILFLADSEMNGRISGRLIHVNEPYLKYGKNASSINSSSAGLLRRVSYDSVSF